MAHVRIDAGICGFVTEVRATSEDGQHVKLHITSVCPNVARIAKTLNSGAYDAYKQIGRCQEAGSIYETEIMAACAGLPHVACPVPSGICKAIEVVAGLALPRDAHIEVSRDDGPEAE